MNLQNKSNPRISVLNELLAEVIYNAVMKIVPEKYAEECFISDAGVVVLNFEKFHTIIFPAGGKLYGMEVFYGESDRAILSPKRKVHLSKEEVVASVKAVMSVVDGSHNELVDAWQKQDEAAEDSEEGSDETAVEVLQDMKKEVYADNYDKNTGHMVSLNESRDPSKDVAYSNTMKNRKLVYTLNEGAIFIDKISGQRIQE